MSLPFCSAVNWHREYSCVLKSENPDLGLLPLSGDCQVQPVPPAHNWPSTHTCFRQSETLNEMLSYWFCGAAALS